MRISNLAGAVLVTVLLITSEVAASGVDLHWLWDDRCAECHGHSGEFARRFLKVDDGQLQGQHHVRDLRLFMRNHYLLNSEVDAVYKMLLAQARTEPRFKPECGACHGSAASFVRRSIVLHDGALLSRESGQSVRSFMQRHRALEPDDIEFFVDLLERVAHEVYRP